MTSPKSILIIGAGVSGLSCAVRLLRDGHRVRIWSREPTLETTSTIAAAVWHPYLVQPEDRAGEWAIRGYREFLRLGDHPDAGVRVHDLLELSDVENGPADWMHQVEGFESLPAGEIASPFVEAFRYRAPVIETPVYLRYLLEQFGLLGGHVESQRLSSIDEADGQDADIVINAAGLGARELANDAEMHPIKGQIVRVEQVGIDTITIYHSDTLGSGYIIPRSRDCVLGGTAERDVWNTDPNEADTASILERCYALEPRLRDARVLGVAVGLRPWRTAIRLEADHLPSGQPLIHNYGHGGAGVTVSLGCAEEVARLVERVSA